VDDADLRELLAVFALDAPGRLERIDHHLETADGLAAANEAHSLSGAAATVGLEALAAEAERLEAELRAGAAPNDVRHRLEAIAALLPELESEESAAAAARADGHDAKRTVLHVEDNPVNVKLVERALAHRPEVRLLSATRADAGLRAAAAARPDLILLDLNLPDGSGRDLLRRLRGEPETRDVPVVVVSAHTPDQGGQALHGLGVRDYLTKPIDIGRLLELVDEHAPTAP
jgi:CheY-like chemotaxis protein/HPt (histidine-containing phosphotransfer) domain-containing protein